MVILLMLALSVSDGGGLKVPSGALPVQAATLPSEPKPWFQQQVRPFGSTSRISPRPRSDERPRSSSGAADPAAMNCAIRIIEADPKFDAEIVRPAPPALDPKIVLPSPCRK